MGAISSSTRGKEGNLEAESAELRSADGVRELVDACRHLLPAVAVESELLRIGPHGELGRPPRSRVLGRSPLGQRRGPPGQQLRARDKKGGKRERWVDKKMCACQDRTRGGRAGAV